MFKLSISRMYFNYTVFLVLLNYVRSERSIKEDIKTDLAETNNETLHLLLQEIMIKSLHAYKSVVIISDPIYSPIFQKSWFKKFGGYISFFMIIVDESEDLLAPTSETQFALNTAKNDGCQMYIILISNGIQTGRLLRFGDRYRVLDTRSNYIILFDNRIFVKKLLYLWKRIINVVFIRKYSSKKVDDKPKRNDWYELTTVPFPMSFQDILIPRRLDIWTNSRFRKGADLFKDKTADLKNQTLKVAAFSHIPGSDKSTLVSKDSFHSNLIFPTNYSFSGSEIEIMDTISKLMNFRCAIYEPENADIELWGRKQVGGIYTGLLGEMTAARADIALGDLYYIPYILNIMDLSTPYNTECLTFLTPEALFDISWKTLILPFSPIMWTCVILTLLISSTSFYLLAKFHLYVTNIKRLDADSDRVQKDEEKKKRKRQLLNFSIHSQITKMDMDIKYSLLREHYQSKKREGDQEGLNQFSDPENSLLYTYSMLLLVSLPKLPTGWSLRMLTGWYWLYCLLVVVAYRASMTAILARPSLRVTIDSLQELIDTKLTYGGWGEINTEFFKSSPDNFINTIRQNFEIVNNSEDAVDRVADGNFAFYENSYFLRKAILKRQIRFQENNLENSTNQEHFNTVAAVKSDRNLHIMKDCIINMPVSIGLQKNSPIKPRVDKLIRKVLEAGLINKWLTDVMQNILNTKMERSGQEQKALMNLKKMYGALVVLGIGYALGCFLLAGEILHYQYIVKRHPGFNKYSRMVYYARKAN